jgi:hypothetical protein
MNPHGEPVSEVPYLEVKLCLAFLHPVHFGADILEFFYELRFESIEDMWTTDGGLIWPP